jgi:hypothetical protein
VDNGKIKVNQEAVVVNHHDPDKLEKVRISKLYEFDGLNKVDVAEAGIGSIVAISGIADIHIGDTICSPEAPEAIPFQKISEPTISMNFIVNNSPLAEAGFTVYGGVNAPYIWLKTPDQMTSWEFFDYLLENANVVGTPGSGFGPSGEGYFRLTAFGNYENTVKALERIKAL